MDISRFFIDRPRFATVLSLFIFLVGALAIPLLPISEYPEVAPPQVVVRAQYPGANPRVISETVATPLEEQINGLENVLYFDSQATGDGGMTLTVTFKIGTHPEAAETAVQNRINRALPRLPDIVRQIGVTTEKSSPNLTMVVHLVSPDNSRDALYLRNYGNLNVRDELLRVPGMGSVLMFGAGDYAMRIWLDPQKLAARSMTASEVVGAIREQNTQVAAGVIGASPAPKGTDFQLAINAQGRLASEDEFGNIIVRSDIKTGAMVRVKDVGRVEISAGTFALRSLLNNKEAAAIAVFQAPGSNALAISNQVRQTMERLKPGFPAGVSYDIVYDPTRFVQTSIEKVVSTLFEAVGLVVLVVIIFLQTWRASIIPLVAVPVSIVGTFAVLLLLGFSINTLTLFGLVLVIGIVVDDAIVVVENVERVMSEEGLSPLKATRKAMGQISGAIVGVTVVLISVFVPLAFFSGAIGNIYRQFSAVMVSAIAFSAFLALSLTPALCATLLKPVEAGHHIEKGGFFGRFNRGFARTAKGYEGWVAKFIRRAGRMAVVYAAVIGADVLVFQKLPTSFVPNEDQGNILVNVQLPPGATQQRTLEVMKQTEAYMLAQPEVESMVSVIGFSFSGSGQNAGLGFITLKPWDERHGTAHSAQGLVARAFPALGKIRDAIIFPVSPPPIRDLGRANGFAFRLQDRSGHTRAELLAARNQLLAAAAKNPLLTAVRPDGLEDAAQLQLDIDRDRAQALGLNIGAVNAVLGTSLGSTYVNDFPNAGRLQRVIVQADAPARMQPEDLLRLHVLNATGQPVPLSAFATSKWITGAMQTVRYNGYPAMRILGEPAKGVSTGTAMAEMEKLAAQLPEGFGYEWTGQSREEKLSGSTAFILFGFSLLAVFLCLAALYESWSIPLSVLLVVPLGVLGVVLGATFRGLENDVYFKVGMITIIGLSAKNAVLIIEFAKELQARGRSVFDAVREAAHLRFRPIIMTSLAFILGVLPLVLASGAGSASQRAIGTGVMGGMLSATLLAVFFVPVFFVAVRRFFPGSERQRRRDAHEAEEASGGQA